MALQDTTDPAQTDPGEPPWALVVGAASRDLAPGDPRGWRLGGAVAYGSLALTRLGIPTRAVIGVDDAALAAAELDTLRNAGVELCPVRLASGPVFDNVETATGRRQRAISASSAMAIDAMPPGWSEAHAVVLAPVAGELPVDWAAIPRPDALVALGWQGLLRHVAAGGEVTRTPPRPHAFVARADLIVVSADDVGADVRLRTLIDLVRPGATLVVTRGDRGGTALTSRRPARSALRAYPAIPPDAVVDPTGAGDVFLAALVATSLGGARLGAAEWADRLTFAAAAASLCVERPGLAGVPSLAAIRRRIADVA